MEYFFSILTIVCTPLFTVIGIIINQKAETKRKKMDVEANKDQDMSSLLDGRITTLFNKVDELTDTVSELKAAHQQTVTLIEVLSERVEKHNNVIERTYALEKQVAVLDNREKVSENRLSDLERHEEKKGA